MNDSSYQPKDLIFDQAAQDKLISGIRKLSAAVKSTLGPRGNTVLIESLNHTSGMTVTKDGVTVAKSIDLLDPVENLAAKLLKQAADKTAISSGDGPQPLYANVLTPTGWTTMGNLCKGDEICGTDGTTQTVLDVFGKGDLEIYEVVFADGRIVECSGNHLWSVTNSWGVAKTLTTEEMSKRVVRINNQGQRQYMNYVRQSVVDFAKNPKAVLDPYLIGLLLGDGSMSGTGSIELSIGKAKEHIINKIKLPQGMSLSIRYYENKNYFRIKITGPGPDGRLIKDYLNDMGLFGVKSATKFIPDEYLYAPIEDRRMLLQGLLDTDGYVNSKNLFEFSTISDTLADDFQELITGLGYAFNRHIHHRSKDEGSYSDKSIHRISQLVGYKYGSKIVDIRPTGVFTQMRCIKVSNEDHLYITNGYIPTHNTSSSVVLTEAIIEAGLEHIKISMNRTKVLREIEKVKQDIVGAIKAVALPVNDKMLEQVAVISANNDKRIGHIVASTYLEVGREGVVTVEKSKSIETYAEITNGIKFNRGWTSRLFINDQGREECQFEDALVMVCDTEITNILHIENVLKPIIQNSQKLLIIGNVSPNVLNTFALNVTRNGVRLCVVAPPSFGYRQNELMEDIAVAVGAKYFSEKTGDDLSLMRYEDLGRASKITVSESSTIIIKNDVNEQAISERIASLTQARTNASTKQEKDFITERIASLSGGVGVIYAGGVTDMEQKELYDRIDDAVCAVRSAIEEGVVPGAGKCLWDIALALSSDVDDLSPERIAALLIMVEAMQAPMMQILENGGEADKANDESLTTPGYGYDLSGEVYCDLIRQGIVDPAKVVRNSIENAVSVATTILSTNAIVTMARSYETK